LRWRRAKRKSIQSPFEEMLVAIVKEQPTITLPIQRQATHAGELTDEDGDKTEREADVLARTATLKLKGTPTPKHVQMGRYQTSDSGSLK